MVIAIYMFSLVYLVGEQSDSTKLRASELRASSSGQNGWIGQNKASFSEDLGIEIFTEMIKIGVDLSIENCNCEDILSIITTTDMLHPLSREKNDRFKELVLSHYNTQIQ